MYIDVVEERICTMLSIELLGIALFIVVLVIIAIACWYIHYLLVALPRQQKDTLDRFSPCVINQVALEYATLLRAQQKQIATEKMRTIFVELGIPSPGDTTIEAKIGDAIYKRRMQWIEELKVDQLSREDTASLPVTPKEEFML